MKPWYSLNRLRVLLIALVGTCSWLAGCHQQTRYPEQPALIARAHAGTTILIVEFVGDVDDVVRACPGLRNGTYYGCSKATEGICTVYVQNPDDFNDVPRLAVLGHEVLHCMGARHGR